MSRGPKNVSSFLDTQALDDGQLDLVLSTFDDEDGGSESELDFSSDDDDDEDSAVPESSGHNNGDIEGGESEDGSEGCDSDGSSDSMAMDIDETASSDSDDDHSDTSENLNFVGGAHGAGRGRARGRGRAGRSRGRGGRGRGAGGRGRGDVGRGRGRGRGGGRGRGRVGHVNGDAADDAFDWTNDDTASEVHDFTTPVPPGPVTDIPAGLALTPIYFFNLIFGFAIPILVAETNRYAQQCGVQVFTATNEREMVAFLGVLIAMGVARLPCMRDYWSKNPILCNTFVASTMPVSRFRALLRFVHLADNTNQDPNSRLSRVVICIHAQPTISSLLVTRS